MARICPLFSGSSGNSYYIGSAEAGILIDAGRTAKQLNGMLAQCGISLAAVKGIFLTHEHSDHIKGLRVFASKNHIPVYGSEGTLFAMERTGDLEGDFQVETLGVDRVACADMEIYPFRTSHDSAESVGYRIRTADDRVVTFSTDLGYISETVRVELKGSDLVVLESNHDVGMLQNGPYPYPLKRRILSDRGHLSNNVCADILPELSKSGATRFLLAHLSSENNTPELAYQTALCSLTLAGLKQGIDYELTVAPRENTLGKIILF